MENRSHLFHVTCYLQSAYICDKVEPFQNHLVLIIVMMRKLSWSSLAGYLRNVVPPVNLRDILLLVFEDEY